MPLIAVLHSPFCPLDQPSGELHYYCDLMNLPRGVELHHHEALKRIHESECSMPAFSPQGDILTMSPSQWQSHLHLIPRRILLPGDSLTLSPTLRTQSGR